MKYAKAILGVGLVAMGYAQYSCALCDAANTLDPRTFDPPFLTIEAGQDTDVVIQFALPETVVITLPFTGIPPVVLYPNFAVFVDSIRLDGDTRYVTLYGSATNPITYNTANPDGGGIRFDQLHRYKKVRSNPSTYAHMVVYQNPGGGSPQSPTPARGCVRACIRGVSSTGNGADTLRILVRGFIDTSSVSISFGFPTTVNSNDIPNKDTTNLEPQLVTPFGNFSVYRDDYVAYAIRVRGSSTTIRTHLIETVSVSPNPTWGAVTLSYTLNHPTKLALRILSLAGQEIQVHDLGWRAAGTHEVRFSLSAGVYLIELRAGEEKQIQKLVVL